MRACRANDLARVRRLIRAGADVNAVTAAENEPLDGLFAGYTIVSGGRSALHLAARCARPAIVVALVDAGAEIDRRDAQGNTPICDAVSGRSAAVTIRYLAQCGAELDVRRGFTPLYRAVVSGQLSLVRLLLSLGASVDHPIWTGARPLAIAASEAQLEIFQLLLDRGAQVDAHDSNRRSALHEVCEAKLDSITVRRAQRRKARAAYVAMAAALLDRGAAVNRKDRDGNTPLLLAADHGLTQVVEMLLARSKANTGIKNCKGDTPLLAAVRMNQLETVATLLRHGVKADARAPRLAKKNGYSEVLALFKRGVAKRSSVADLRAIYALGKYKEALAGYERLPPEEANIFEVNADSGYCLQQLGRHAEAVARFEAAVKQEPKRPNLFRALCYSYWALDDWTRMESSARRAIALQPADAYAWLQLGIAFLGAKQYARAEVPLRKSLTFDPGDATTHFSLGEALWHTGQRCHESFVRALELNPSLAAELRDAEYADLLRADPKLAQRVEPTTRD
jgi:ankyrin repeat protein